MSKPVLVIGNKNYSSWSLRPWLLLKHLGVDFDEVRIPLYVEGAKERILEYSPGGKVPVYIDGGVIVWESLAIMEYLAESHPSVWPAGQGSEGGGAVRRGRDARRVHGSQGQDAAQLQGPPAGGSP